MPSLTPAQIAAAKKAGVADSWITRYQQGYAAIPSGVLRQINDAKAEGNRTGGLSRSSMGGGGSFDSVPANQFKIGLPGPSISDGATAIGNALQLRSPYAALGIPDVSKQAGSIVKKPVAKTGYQNTFDPFAAMSKAIGQPSTRFGSVPDFVDPGPDPYPTYSGADYSIPTVTPRDFTSDAKRMASEAFAPYLGSFDTAKQNATAQAGQSKQAVGSLYDKFVQDIATKAAEQGQQYQQAGSAAGQRATDLGSQIGANYSGANAQLGEQLGKLGLSAAASTVLGQSANDQAWQQSQAAQGGKAQQDYYATQGQGQQDYMRAYGNMQQNEGVTAQSGIDRQLSQFLQNTDIAKAGALSEEAQQAIDIANQLSQRDLSAQSTNAGFTMQGNQLRQQDNQAAYQGQVGAWTAAQQAKQSAAAQQQQDFENQIATAKLGLDTAAAGAKVSGAGATAITDFQGPGRAKAQLESQYGASGTQLFNDAISLLTDFYTRNQAGGDPLQLKAQFINEAKNNAISRGADVPAALTAAMQVWDATSK